MSRGSGRSWGLAVAAAVLVTSAAVLPRAGAMAHGAQQFVLRFELAASQATTAEVFFDRGAGFDTRSSVLVPVSASTEPLPYAVPLAPGRYHGIRLDPFPADGDLVLQHARIADRYGRGVAPLDLSRLQPSTFVTIRGASADRVAAAALPGHGDPQLVYAFERPRFLWLSRRDAAWFLLEALLIGVIVAAAAYLAQRPQAPTPLAPAALGSARRPGRAIVLAAAASTLLAMYPLLLGRSLVTPNNGPTALVYTSPPYAAGSADTAIEDARAADVKATMLLTLPYAMALREALAHGEFPWWNRYSETGVPLWGQAQTSFLDPLQWLLLAGDLAVGADLKFITARLLFVSGAGLAALAATGSVGAALLITAAAPFLGHFIFRLNDPIHFSIVYAPWILVMYGRMLRARETRGAATAAAGLLISSTLLMVSSSLKEAFALLPAVHLAGLSAIALDGWRGADWSTAWRRLGLSAAALAGAALLTAPLWLIFLETLSAAFTAYDTSVFDFARGTHAVALVAGVFRPGMLAPALNPVLGVLMILGVLATRKWVAQPLVVTSALVATMMIAIAFGGVPEDWLAQLPFFARIHHIGSTFSTAVLPLLVIVAAAGAASLGSLAARGPIPRAALSVAVGALFTIAYAWTADLSDPLAALGFTACVWSGVLCYALLEAAGRANRLALAIAIVTLAGLLLPAGLHLGTGIAALDRLLMQPRLRAPLTSVPDALRPAASPHAQPARIVGLNGVVQGGVPTYFGLEGITGADVLFSPQTFWLGKQFEPEYFPLWFQSPDARASRLAPLFDLWGVRWLLAPRDTRLDAQPGDRDDRLVVIERPTAWPRAFFVDRVEVHHEREAFVTRLRADSRPFASIRSDDEAAVDATRRLLGDARATAFGRDYRLTANTTSFVVTAPGPGVVVLNEGFWPGVRATIDGGPMPVFRVNETMRGVVVPAGTQSITFAYRPARWNMALALAAAGVATFAALALTAVMARPRAGGGAP